MKQFALIILALGLVLLGGALFGFGKRSEKKAQVKINDRTFQVDVADTMMTRTQGLSGRPELKESEGMLFVFDSPGVYGFWMKDMHFPIDIIWIEGNRIAGILHNVKPEGSILNLTVHNPPEPIDRVLEIGGGISEKYGIRVGDSVEVVYN